MLSPGLELLAQAQQASDDGEADRLAVAAIVAEPNLAEAYAFRGELAARRGDAVTAAHHFRAAYARGDRSGITRAALAACYEAINEPELADDMGNPGLPVALEAFGELTRVLSAAIRGMMALPLPPPGEPALLPGERRPTGAIPRVEAPAAFGITRGGRGASSRPPSPMTPPSAQVLRSASTPPRPMSAPPAARPASMPPAARPLSSPPARMSAPSWSTPPGSMPSEPVPQARWSGSIDPIRDDQEVEWLEPHHSRRSRQASPRESRGGWVDDDMVPMGAGEGGERFEAVPLELVVDPGIPDGPIRSPATGQFLAPDELQRDRAGAMMPGLELGGRVRAVRSATPAAGRNPASSPGEVRSGARPAAEPDRPVTRVTRTVEPAARPMDTPSARPPEARVTRSIEPISARPAEADRVRPLEARVTRTLDPVVPRGSTPPRNVLGDALEAASAFPAYGMALRLALDLPGPVVTAPGARPQQLCTQVAFGLTGEEILLSDRALPDRAPVRIALQQLPRMDLLRDGQQLSFTLTDGRQLHLDLRGLRQRAPDLVRLLVVEIGGLLRALGAQVSAG